MKKRLLANRGYQYEVHLAQSSPLLCIVSPLKKLAMLVGALHSSTEQVTVKSADSQYALQTKTAIDVTNKHDETLPVGTIIEAGFLISSTYEKLRRQQDGRGV